MNRIEITVEATKDPVRIPRVPRTFDENGKEPGLIYPGEPKILKTDDPSIARWVRRRIACGDLREPWIPPVDPPPETETLRRSATKEED